MRGGLRLVANIYVTASETVFSSSNNGQTFEHINDELSNYLEFLHIGHNGFLYGIRNDRLVKSIDPITGVRESHANGLIVKVYPNPARAFLKVEVESEAMQGAPYEIYIYDIFGRVMLKNEKYFKTDCLSIDISHLTAGYYLVEIRQNGKIYKSSFVKN